MLKKILIIGSIAVVTVFSACAPKTETATKEVTPSMVLPGGEYEKVPLEKDELVLLRIVNSC